MDQVPCRPHNESLMRQCHLAPVTRKKEVPGEELTWLISQQHSTTLRGQGWEGGQLRWASPSPLASHLDAISINPEVTRNIQEGPHSSGQKPQQYQVERTWLAPQKVPARANPEHQEFSSSRKNPILFWPPFQNRYAWLPRQRSHF